MLVEGSLEIDHFLVICLSSVQRKEEINLTSLSIFTKKKKKRKEAKKSQQPSFYYGIILIQHSFKEALSLAAFKEQVQFSILFRQLSCAHCR